MNDNQWLVERDKALYALCREMLAAMQSEDVRRAQAVFDAWKRVVKDVGDETI